MASRRDYHSRFEQGATQQGEPSLYGSSQPPEYSSVLRFSNDQAESYSTRDDHRQSRRMGDDRISRDVMSSTAGPHPQEREQFLKPSTNGHDGVEGVPSRADSVSQYTDPNEYGHVIIQRDGSNFTALKEPQFLQQDPYARSTAHSVTSYLDRGSTITTLCPDDSISAYGMRAQSKKMAPVHEEFGRQYPSTSYQDNSLQDRDHGMLFAVPHNGSVDNKANASNLQRGESARLGLATSTDHDANKMYGQLQYGQLPGPPYESSAYYTNEPSAGHMQYADDEDDERRRREHYWNDTSINRDDDEYYEDWDKRHSTPADMGPSLLSNNMLGPADHDALYSKENRLDDDKRGLLSTLKSLGGSGRAQEGIHKPRPGWGGTIEEQIERRRAGLGRQRWPFLSWALGVSYVIVFIVELVKSKQETGQAIQTKPTINPMIGPPYEFLIAFGARFVPCMRQVPELSLSTPMICLKDSALSPDSTTQTCPLYEICGLPDANTYGQAWRFITPIFVHAGFIHIAFNLLAQITLCAQMEKIISTPLYALVFVAGGIGGNLLGGNFGLVGLPSVGASGAIYACISLELVDLLYNWKYEYRPKTRLVASIIFTIVGFGIGLLPGLDNFAHIGGFAVGIFGGLMLGPAIHQSRRHFVCTCFLRILAAGALIGFFVGLGLNFYRSADPRQTCTWCRYLSCLPVFSQCKGNGFTTTTTTTTTDQGSS